MSSAPSRDTQPDLGFEKVLRRVALVVEALAGTLVAVIAVIVPLIPECTGTTAPTGGLACSNALGRGGWLLFLVAIIGLGVVVVALRGFASASKRSERLLLAGQVPVIGAAIFVLDFYRINPARPPVWGALAIGASAAIIVLTSPRRRRSTISAE